MSTFTVLSASVKKVLEPDPPKRPVAKKVIVLNLRDQMDQTKDAEWYTDATTTVPEAGAKLDGELENSDWGLKFKPLGGGGFRGGGGGFKQTHPVDAARMGRCHAQDMALSYMAIKAQLGKVQDFKPSDLWELINWFDEDVKRSSEAYAKPPVRKDVERTGASDVPVPQQEEFVQSAVTGSNDDIPF